MSPPLIATPAAHDKLRAFCERTPQPWTAPDPADTLVRMRFVGDPILAQITARVVSERFPPSVADYVIDRVTWIGVGFRTLGFCGPALQADDDRPFVIAVSISGTDEPALARFQDVVAHEAAHAWLFSEPRRGTFCASSFWMTTMHELPIADVHARVPEAVDVVLQQRRAYARHEQQARALTRAWGFSDL